MKAILRIPAIWLLTTLAGAILSKYKPRIIMVTGSVGKTSTKDAVAAALSGTTYLRASEKSYNSEFGVPLTIIGAKAPWENPSAWIGVFMEGFALLFLPNRYPKLLVLEVGADRPGDLEKILRYATPDLVVVTRLPDVPVHVEAYPAPRAVREEEFLPALALSIDGALVHSADDPYARAMAARLPVRTYTYGYAEDATVRILASSFVEGGMQATARFNGKECAIRAQGVIGDQQLYAPAAALAAALLSDVSCKEALKGLDSYMPPPGRARVLKGMKGSTLIDDSYNSSPAAVEEALNALPLVANASRRIAVLGDMLELGRYSVEQHERIGKLAGERADLVVAVGVRSRSLADGARTKLPEDAVIAVDDAKAAVELLSELVQENDAVLIKGSQGMRMERITEQLLLDAADAKLLARQDMEWKRR